MSGKYDKYIAHPPHREIFAEDDGRRVFNGRWLNYKQIGYNINMGLQFVRKPFKSNNPCHTHNFDEFLAWYGGNPEDPEDFGGEVVFYLGPELEKHVFTSPTVVFLPNGFPHCPLEITRVDRPIIQLEIMLAGDGMTREPYFEEDKGKKH
ncbi:MAG TPA: hypothetical protein VMB24_02990 [Dehalococcoidales bacterium]|nr:hypothetical protein [Dehalococcoidales bacterium]